MFGTFPVKVGFLIEARTGCTCCRNQNYYRGVFDTYEDAVKAATEMYNRKALSSQYAPNGIYDICQVQYEQLPDDRIIIGDRVFEDTSIWEDSEDWYPVTTMSVPMKDWRAEDWMADNEH